MSRMFNDDEVELVKEMIAHLEYCGYGDSWERECADADQLPERAQRLLGILKGEIIEEPSLD